jgi:hypothetical protein
MLEHRVSFCKSEKANKEFSFNSSAHCLVCSTSLVVQVLEAVWPLWKWVSVGCVAGI